MDTLQAELRASFPILDIQIVGINEFGQDPPGSNDLMTANRTTPWLQDVDGNANQVSDVWYDSWEVTYRDVIILDGQNEIVDVFNLTPPEGYDLGVAENYAALQDKLVDAAMAEQKPWQNRRDRHDINDDGFVVPGDVLIMINEINANGPLELAPPTGTSLEAPFWDCNGDNFFSPLDILQVINFIEGVEAEGEASDETGMAMALLNSAIQTMDSLPSMELRSVGTPLVDVAPVPATEPHPSANVTEYEASANERGAPSTVLNQDDFWAGYWPSL